MLPAALKIVEDRKFDTHVGVIRWRLCVRPGRTLSRRTDRTRRFDANQQLVRSYFRQSPTFGRKFEGGEAVMAMLLEIHFDKKDLMNSYINEIHLGQEGDRAGFTARAGLVNFILGSRWSELECTKPHAGSDRAGPSY